MYEFLKNRWVLLLVLIVFIMFKIPHLLYPFYWDECSPYVPAIKEMYRNGISLLPTAIDPELSRGHPLFFHAAGALWMHIFGPSDFSLHCFALSISLLFLITVFEAGYRIFNQRVAVISLLLVAMHVSFFVQSSFVLFEVLVAFLCFLSIFLYVRERYLLCALSLTALFLTKESGLIAGFVIGIDALISLPDKSIPVRKRILKLVPVATACIAIGIFFLIQKHLRGWYVFPLYSDTILTKWSDIWFRFGTAVVNTVFCEGYEYVIFIALIVYTVIMLVKTRSLKNAALLSLVIPFAIAYYAGYSARIYTLGFNMSNPFYPTLLAFIVFSLFYIVTLFSFSRTRFYTHSVQRKFIILTGMFALCFIYFSSLAYFIPRYLLPAIIPVLFLLGVFFDMLIRKSYQWLYYPLLVIIIVSSLYSFKQSKGWSDNERGFFKGIKTQVAVVEFMERSNLYDQKIYAGNYQEYVHLHDPNSGFLSTTRNFKNIVPYTQADYLIFDNIDPDRNYDSVAKNPAYDLIYKIDYDEVWAEIYKRK